MIVSFFISAIALSLILSVGIFRERILVEFKNDLLKTPEVEKTNWRINRWDVAFDFIKQSPVIGHGTGSEIPMLKAAYFEKKMYGAYLNSLNVHNQYLSFLLNSGIIGLIIFLFTLSWGFWQAIRHKDLMLFSFIFILFITSFSENIFDVNKGIFFYAFFFSFFITSCRSRLNS